MANSKGKKDAFGTKHPILKEILDTLHFHLFESGGEMAKNREIPINPKRPGSITPEHLKKIRAEMLANQLEWERTH